MRTNQPNPRVFYLLQKAHSALFRAADRYLKERIGLSTSQHAVLLLLAKSDGLTLSAIAESLSMGKSSLSGLIDRMAAKGLLRRCQNGADARSYQILLEPAGRELVSGSLLDTKRLNSELLAPFSTAERATIDRFLNHVARNADAIVAPVNHPPESEHPHP